MCGIAGIVGARQDGWINHETVQRMCAAIVHRGPDDEGIHVHAGAGLGMRRLSIIDLPGGHQPIFNEDRSVFVVFNGEIYNFIALRNELENLGHSFSTNCDTEVIVHAYEEFGADCVKKLRGMFAFALYDSNKKTLLLARDRLGKKPLHYALMGDRLLFGSEIKAILSVAPELSETDADALLQYFYFGYVQDPRTAFSSVKKLPPGCTLEFKNGEVRINQYWDLPQYGTYSPANDEECLRELEDKLSEAVKIRLMSDVPIGALLSGGVDSSTVVALMARLSPGRVKTFSIGFRQADFDETPYARLVAERFGTEHHELILEPDVVDTVESLSRSLEEPFGDSSMLPTYFVSRLARKHVKVVLTGDGGDEAFAGYERYRTYIWERSKQWMPSWMGRFYREQVYSRLPRRTFGRNYAYSRSLSTSERYIEAVSLQPEQRNLGLLSDGFLASFAEGSDPLALFRGYMEGAPASDPLSRALYLDAKTYLPGDILTKVDRMSMAVSLEARVPMLDHVFLEWATSLKPEWKMKGGGQKFILKKFAERIGVPSALMNRPKQGFALPLLHWMRNELKEMVYSLLLDARSLQRGYFAEAGIRRLLNNFLNGDSNDYLPIWRLMMFELWQRNFLEPLRAHSKAHIERAVVVSSSSR